MYLLIYDIEAKRDPHGIRVRLVRALRRSGAFQIQRSVWLVESITQDLQRLVDEFRRAGGKVKASEWLPRPLSEILSRPIGMKKIVLAVNGSEPISAGWHAKLGEILEREGYTIEVRPISESAMEEYSALVGIRADIASRSKSISRIIDEIALDDMDGIVILNSGRTSQSGMMFMAQTIANTRVLKNMTSLPVVQVESLGKPDCGVIVWNEEGRQLGETLSKSLSIPVIVPSVEVKRASMNGQKEIRQIQYANIGDTIIVNGVEVGECLTDKVYLIAEGGALVDIMGGKIFRRKAKKLRLGSLAGAIVKTVPRQAKG